MLIIKHLKFTLKGRRYYLGGFFIVWKHQSVERLGYESRIGILLPQLYREGIKPKVLQWSRYEPDTKAIR